LKLPSAAQVAKVGHGPGAALRQNLSNASNRAESKGGSLQKQADSLKRMFAAADLTERHS